MMNNVKAETKIEDNMINKMKKLFAPQIAYDKKHGNLNSKDFSGSNQSNLKDYIKIVQGMQYVHAGVNADVQTSLNIETGQTYKADIKEENQDQPVDSKYIKYHQSKFNPKFIYPMADDIDFFPAPLSHKDFWLYLNGNADEVSVHVQDDLAGQIE